MSQLNISEMNRGDLEEEYQLSQWALSWALHKLGGTLTITSADMEDRNINGRIWYTRQFDGSTQVEFRELNDESGITRTAVNLTVIR